MSDIEFSVKSIFSFLATEVNNGSKSLWKVIGKWSWPKRVKTFMCLLLKEKLLTNVFRTIRHLIANDRCLWCDLEAKTCLHAIRDRPKIKDNWYKLFHP